MDAFFSRSTKRLLPILVSFLLTSVADADQFPAKATVKVALEAIQQIGPEGSGYAAAQQAARQLRQLPSNQVFVVLEAMKPGQLVANNWFRGVASDIVLLSGLPASSELISYLSDTAKSQPGRAMAYRLWLEAEPDGARNWVAEQLEDPSLLIREAAVAQALGKLPTEDSAVDGDSSDIKTLARRILQSARHPKQVNQAIKTLDKLGEKVTEADAFKMLLNWQSIGPFDNRGGIGFDEVYAPEKRFEESGIVDLQAEYEGKNGPVTWQKLTGSTDDGMVDLAAAYDKEKGAVAYVYTEFESSQPKKVQARLGCACANQIWLNGQKITSNKVYHSGTMVDQYVANGELKAGTNRILMKICQNEQTEGWAQDWDFRFRLTDLTGKGLESQ